jgi:hypothetical protein
MYKLYHHTKSRTFSHDRCVHNGHDGGRIFGQNGKIEPFRNVLNALQVRILINRPFLLVGDLFHTALHVELQRYVRGRDEAANAEAAAEFNGRGNTIVTNGVFREL